MTFFDLINCIAGLVPILIGFKTGMKAGILGIAVGLIIGSIIGIGTFLLIRVPIARFLDRYGKNIPDNIWGVVMGFLLYLPIFAIILLAGEVAKFIVNVVVNSFL